VLRLPRVGFSPTIALNAAGTRPDTDKQQVAETLGKALQELADIFSAL